ncbi:hypothetical protein FQN54_004217 [Arachnomyces sp. PD_36]|nr:hypothetical protein FQN54_004217 [Arachnomyces sp. PD_36]
MDSSPSRARCDVPVAAGMKRPASLLPPFEPLTSSPTLPRPVKRLARESEGGVSTYPTPVPTSSTLVPTSSPPQLPNSRPFPAKRTHSVSERAPLSTVPSVMLNASGEPLLMGRSSASSHYQLSANRLISRVHVQASYKPTDNPFDRDRVEILCKGWNGIKLHCQGKTYDLAKGKTFTSDIKDADIMIDVQDARVLVQWPRAERKDSGSSDRAWEEESPSRTARRSHRRTPPLRERQPLASPVSPSPAVQALIPPSSPLLLPTQDTQSQVVVYEDEPSPTPKKTVTDPLNVSQTTQLASQDIDDENIPATASSPLSDAEDFSDHDEENDPIIHSFGPFGDNILSRMTSFTAGGSPAQPARAKALGVTDSPPQPSARKPASEADKANVENHIVNQLAFSRLSSTPLSTILSNLPSGLWRKNPTDEKGLTRDEIKTLLEAVQCIGKVTREGKDAAGKPLESEYHYIPDLDEDEKRKEAVVSGLMKPGLRNCRKQHKVRASHTLPPLLHFVNVISTAILLAQAQINLLAPILT